MIALNPELFLDTALIEIFKPRFLKRILKASLAKNLKRWHEEILPGHFRRRAYDKYRSQYGSKKKKGRPMVVTGQLERSVTGNINITSTSNRATGRVNFGRPKTLTKRQIKGRAIALRDRENITFQQAERRIYASQGNYAKNRLQFQLQISAFSKKDVEIVQGWVVNDVLEAMKDTGNLRKVRKVG